MRYVIRDVYVIPLYLLIHMSPATQVNGSSHTALGPYWADVLGKPSLRAVAASKRSGDIAVEVCECIRCCGLRCHAVRVCGIVVFLSARPVFCQVLPGCAGVKLGGRVAFVFNGEFALPTPA